MKLRCHVYTDVYLRANLDWPSTMSLHWLPISECITYKLCTLELKALDGLALHYQSELCKPTTDNAYYQQHLRSADQGLLSVSMRKLETFGPCALSTAS